MILIFKLNFNFFYIALSSDYVTPIKSYLSKFLEANSLSPLVIEATGKSVKILYTMVAK